jgi:hypothetical protein
MVKQFFYFPLFLIFLTCCNGTGKQLDTGKKDSTSIMKVDTSITTSYSYKNEQEYLKRKEMLCNRLALYDIAKGMDDYELRMWFIPSMWDPSILYILKAKDTTWTLFHYQVYMHRSTSEDHKYDDPVVEYFNNPLVDSVEMESVRPQKMDWNTYINNLQLDSLWNLQTESLIKGKTFAMLDGHRYLLEFTGKGKYKYLFYTAPEYFQDKDVNHKSFTNFKKRLVDPIIYKGMRNP